ncbi:DUF397 domain-containing protein [uncultured Streptomyces sp.]|uniref:DUF397 domain-containing protein n=1 Tax=uncultured Streptomyces sp. TaxID=174707 RepID=UPI00261324F1|nr:DUF397 domain-containing protein [uncultured Streptomyces sp.]
MNTLATETASNTVWRKSSYSGAEGGECLEVATRPDAVLLRDSKNPHGPVLATTPHHWTAFVAYAAKH